MDRDPDEVGLGELRVGVRLGELGRPGPEDLRDVAGGGRRGVLELEVGRPDASDVTAGPCERNPRRGVFSPPSVIMFGFGSFVASTGSVQYLKDVTFCGVAPL